MGRIYDFYEQRIFPRVLDVAMRGMNDLRPTLLDAAEGEVLEIGFGTGLNLRHYPPSVKRLAGIDPMEALPEKVQQRIDSVAFPVEVRHLRADGALPYEADSFDCVTVTWTLCTIPDPVLALQQARRVLKPGGKLLFIEHGRSEDAGVARWQDRLNPLQNVIGCGCNLNRQIDALVEEGGFRIAHLDRFAMEGTPRVFGEMFRGEALPAN